MAIPEMSHLASLANGATARHTPIKMLRPWTPDSQQWSAPLYVRQNVRLGKSPWRQLQTVISGFLVVFLHTAVE